MTTKIKTFSQSFLKKDLPDIRPGDTIKVYQKIKEGKKERIQGFEGLVLARKHGKGVSATITVKRVSKGVGVEKIFPIHLPSIEKIEVLRKGKVRRAKLYYLRTAKGKRARIRRKEDVKNTVDKKPSIKKPEKEEQEVKEKK
ncbi:MAG TPA: 50S ribosomal protein L19 [bacterium]|nr:50S ribosomal protein L19 [bacterium]